VCTASGLNFPPLLELGIVEKQAGKHMNSLADSNVCVCARERVWGSVGCCVRACLCACIASVCLLGHARCWTTLRCPLLAPGPVALDDPAGSNQPMAEDEGLPPLASASAGMVQPRIYILEFPGGLDAMMVTQAPM
jgi:hypothetical protein